MALSAQPLAECSFGIRACGSGWAEQVGKHPNTCEGVVPSGDKSLENEGKGDQVESNLKDAGEKVKC